MKGLAFLLDLFFPKKCLGCNKAGVYICNQCLDKFETVPVPYSNPLIKELIKNFKYNYIKELANPLAKLLCSTPGVQHGDVIIPIPLHKRKLRERGFNQAELLAREVAKHFSLPLETKILIKKKYTPSQAKTKNREQRKQALKNAFAVVGNKNLIKDKTVILVDDVATSGTTLSEATKALKSAGAKEVRYLVVAKG